MITTEERNFAQCALSDAEHQMGRILIAVTEEAPSDKAKSMAQLLVTAGLLTKLGMSRTRVPGNFGESLDNLLEQLEFQWAKMQAGGDIDLDEIVYPDEPGDYINRSE
jgi:hypothetical protein